MVDSDQQENHNDYTPLGVRLYTVFQPHISRVQRCFLFALLPHFSPRHIFTPLARREYDVLGNRYLSGDKVMEHHTVYFVLGIRVYDHITYRENK